MRSTRKQRSASARAAFATAAAIVLSAVGAARAALTLDLRSTDSANPKLVYAPAGTAYVLHFDLYAVVTGHDADPTNDGVQDAFFSLVSTNTVPPGLKGNLAISLVAPFDGVTSGPGTQIDCRVAGAQHPDPGWFDARQAVPLVRPPRALSKCGGGAPMCRRPDLGKLTECEKPAGAAP